MAGVIRQQRPSPPPQSATRTPAPRAVAAPAPFLSPFDNLYAPVIAAWPKSAKELVWLAPGTVGPLTPAKVCAWKRSNGRRILFWADRDGTPAGYAELNRMPDERRRYWIGHFIIDPARRGRGHSHTFFRALVHHAFESMGAAEVLLVVFPENAPAIRCYEAGGMIVSGRECKLFETTGRRHQFLRMCIHRRRYDRLDLYRDAAVGLPFVRSAYRP